MAFKDGSSYRISATPATLMAHLLGIAAITLMLVWILHFGEGLGLNSKNIQRNFNVHPFLMLLGLIFCGGEAIMAYKTVPATRKVQKFVHMALHFAALVLGALGLYAAFKFHRDVKLPDMYSLHSWLGMGTIGLYALQWFIAFIYFLFPGASMTTRANYAPWHAFFGIVIFLMSIVSAETGLVQKFISSRLLKGSEALLMNFTGLAIFLFGMFVILSAILPRAYY